MRIPSPSNKHLTVSESRFTCMSKSPSVSGHSNKRQRYLTDNPFQCQCMDQFQFLPFYWFDEVSARCCWAHSSLSGYFRSRWCERNMVGYYLCSECQSRWSVRTSSNRSQQYLAVRAFSPRLLLQDLKLIFRHLAHLRSRLSRAISWCFMSRTL